MVLRLIEATQAKPGVTITIDGEPYSVKSNDISKTGKHGASKCRIEAIGIFSGKKKVTAVNGGEKFEVPLVEKHRAQILNISEDKVSVMNLASYETLELPFIESVKSELAPEKEVEYWDVEGKRVIMRVL